MTAPRPRSRQPRQLDAGIFQAEISSFRLHLAAEGKSAKTVRTYTEAVQWFAAAHLLAQTRRTGWEDVDGQDVQRWMAGLLGRYSGAYASNQYRALQQFFKWLAAEEELPDPMAGLHPPKVTSKLVPVFTSQELSRLARACAGRSFAQRRDTAIVAVLKATGIRLSELAGIRYDPTTRSAATSTCGTGRSPSAARAESPGSSRSVTMPPAASTATPASAPATRRQTGRSYGSGSATGGR